MGVEDAVQMDIGTLFHGLLFAYQKATKDALGYGCEVFVQPTLENLAKIDDQKLLRGKTLEESVALFSDMLLKARIVTKISFERVESEGYLLKIDGCVWAKHIHKELKPKDVTCPFALIVMAMYNKYSGEIVGETESKYSEEGTETEIRPFNPTLIWRTIEQSTL